MGLDTVLQRCTVLNSDCSQRWKSLLPFVLQHFTFMSLQANSVSVTYMTRSAEPRHLPTPPRLGLANMSRLNTALDAMNNSTQSYKASITGWRDDRRRPSLHFSKIVNGEPRKAEPLDTKSIASSDTLSALSKAKDLHIVVYSGNDPVSICAVQDMLFAFVDRIPSDHRLRSLKVGITVVLPNDANERSMAVSDVWQTRLTGEELIHEGKRIQPGDLSRMHMTAFLTDPLRKIRNIKDKSKPGVCTIEFAGYSGIVWKEIPRKLKELVCGETEVPDYEVFRRYFAVIRYLVQSLKLVFKHIARLQRPPPDATSALVTPASTGSLGTIDLTEEDDTIAWPRQGRPKPDSTVDLTGEEDTINLAQQGQIRATPALANPNELIDLTGEADDESNYKQDQLGLPGLQEVTKQLAMARIKASFGDLRSGYEKLMDLGEDAHRMALKVASDSPEDQGLSVGIENLEKSFRKANDSYPRKTDVSYYGYNESDIKLAAHKSGPEGDSESRSSTSKKSKKRKHLSKEGKKNTTKKKAKVGRKSATTTIQG